MCVVQVSGLSAEVVEMAVECLIHVKYLAVGIVDEAL
jgi:hypothetical protein